MNVERFAALIVRIFGLNWMVSGLTYFFYLPRYIWNTNLAVQRRSNYVWYYQAEVQWTIAHMIFEIVLGTAVFVGWKRVVKFLVKDVPLPREQE